MNSTQRPKGSLITDFHDESWHTPQGKLIREVVFGVNDGLITTLGFVAGVSGSLLERNLILVAGLAEMFAGTVSMAIGAYVSTKSQNEFFQREIDRERREIEEEPEREKSEIRDIYREKGFTEGEVEMLVNRITQDKENWLRFMLKEELGLIQESFDNPVRIGGTMGLSFFVGAVIPLLPFIVTVRDPLKFSILIGVVALFALGAGKTRLTKKNWMRSGVEIMLLGGFAAGAGFLLGKLISVII